MSSSISLVLVISIAIQICLACDCGCSGGGSGGLDDLFSSSSPYRLPMDEEPSTPPFVVRPVDLPKPCITAPSSYTAASYSTPSYSAPTYSPPSYSPPRYTPQIQPYTPQPQPCPCASQSTAYAQQYSAYPTYTPCQRPLADACMRKLRAFQQMLANKVRKCQRPRQSRCDCCKSYTPPCKCSFYKDY